MQELEMYTTQQDIDDLQHTIPLYDTYGTSPLYLSDS